VTNHYSVPARSDAKERWQALLEGRTTRREVHEWAALWVEERDSEVEDPMLRNALQHLHGFDLTYDSGNPRVMRHNKGGERYVHSDEEVADALAQWEANCRLYDSDPAAYLRQAKERALSSHKDDNRCGGH
jgi:hypothetical protein